MLPQSLNGCGVSSSKYYVTPILNTQPQLSQLQRPEPCPLPGREKTLRRECEPRFSDCSSQWPALSPSYNICNKFHPLYLFNVAIRNICSLLRGTGNSTDFSLIVLTANQIHNGLKAIPKYYIVAMQYRAKYRKGRKKGGPFHLVRNRIIVYSLLYHSHLTWSKIDFSEMIRL